MGSDRMMYSLWRNPPEEDEDADPRDWAKSGRTCDCCGDELSFTDEIFVLEVVEATVENGQFFMDLLREDDTGDALYYVYVVHLECWETALEEMREAVEDKPPMEYDDPIIKCSCCECTIANFEPFISTQFGEIHVSKRVPSGRPTSTIERLGTATPVCVACIAHVIPDHFEEWEELIELLPEEDRPTGDQEDE